MFKIVVGHSNDPDSLAAVEEVIQQCNNSLTGDIPQAGILFTAIDFDHPLILQQIYQAFPGIELIGGTTDGEISSVLEFQQDSITLMLFCSDEIEIFAGVGQKVSLDPIVATRQAVEQAKAKTTKVPQLCLTHPESLTTSGVSILNGLKLALGEKFPIFGGLAADQSKYQNTYQFFQTQVLSDSVPVLLFSGNVLFSHGVASGWLPIGKTSKVTKVEKNIVYEIDDKPLVILKHRLKANQNRPEIQVIKNYGNLPIIKCFPGQLSQVFMNIFANAIDALEESNHGLSFATIEEKPNKIIIQTDFNFQNNFVVIRIKDNALGIPKAVKTKIFEHSFTTKPVGKGTGLGLAIAHQIIVQKHGGTIEVESTLGQGSEFIITLPMNL
jgi:hypothetical protein